MTNIVKNYFRVLEVISSFDTELDFKSGVGRKPKMSDIEVVALSLTAEFMSIYFCKSKKKYFICCLKFMFL